MKNVTIVTEVTEATVLIVVTEVTEIKVVTVITAAAAVLGFDGSLLLKIPDHIKALGTLPASGGQIHSTFPEIHAQCIIKSLHSPLKL